MAVRVRIGKLGASNYGLEVSSPTGVTIIDGTSNMFKILASGTLSVTISAAATDTVTDVVLSALGEWTTIPMVLAGISQSTALTGNIRSMIHEGGYTTLYAAQTSGGSPTIDMEALLYHVAIASGVTAGDDEAFVRIGGARSGGAGTRTFYATYHLLQEAAL